MKILLINVVYGKGSTGNIVKSLYDAYKTLGHDVKILYGRSSSTQDNPNIFKCTSEVESKIHHGFSKISGNMYGGMFFSTKRILRKIKCIKPDVVHVHCINGYFVNIYKLLSFLAKNKIKTILTMHADFMMTGGCGYTVDCKKYLNGECRGCKRVHEFNSKISLNRTHKFYKKFEKTISKFDYNDLRITCVSPWLANRYKESPIYSKYFVTTVLNPVDKIFFEKSNNNPYKTKQKNILYVTSDIYDREKSGFYIEELAEKLPEYNFTILCSKEVDYKTKHSNVDFIIGKGLSRNLIRDYYANADASILLSKRETYSMVVAESLICGTPALGFKCGGPESVDFSNESRFFDYGMVDAMVRYLSNFIKPTKILMNVDLSHVSIANVYLSLLKK